MKVKVYVYNENCPYAGRTVPAEVLERYDGDIDAAGDWSVFEGTPEELLAQADTSTAFKFSTAASCFHPGTVCE